jgi:hypothetical protein
MDLTAFHNVLFGFTFDLGPDFELVAEFHLVVLAIARAHGGHAFAIARRHRARDTRCEYQRRTNQQGPKGHGGIFDDLAIHESILRNYGFFCAVSLRLPASLAAARKASQVCCLRPERKAKAMPQLR